jgi:hypothetical protein
MQGQAVNCKDVLKWKEIVWSVYHDAGEMAIEKQELVWGR